MKFRGPTEVYIKNLYFFPLMWRVKEILWKLQAHKNNAVTNSLQHVSYNFSLLISLYRYVIICQSDHKQIYENFSTKLQYLMKFIKIFRIDHTLCLSNKRIIRKKIRQLLTEYNLLFSIPSRYFYGKENVYCNNRFKGIYKKKNIFFSDVMFCV